MITKHRLVQIVKHELQYLKMSINQYQQIIQIKQLEFQELNDQFNEYQQQSNSIISDLEAEIKELKKKNQSLSKEVQEMKEKRKNYIGTVERQIEQTKRERQQFRNKFVEFEKKVIELENTNETLQSDLRATKAILSEYEQRTEKTMEELALLQIQMQETTQSNQQQIARLRSQLKQTQDELFALHHAKQIRADQNPNVPPKQEQNCQAGRRNSLMGSKMGKKNNKFGETLHEIRNFIEQISCRREEIDKKFAELLN